MKPILLLLTAALTLFSQTYTFSDGGNRIRVDAAPDQIYIAMPASMDRTAALANVRKSWAPRSAQYLKPAGAATS